MHAIEPNKTIRKHRRLLSPRLIGMEPIRIPYLKGLVDIYTDEQYKATIKNLSES